MSPAMCARSVTDADRLALRLDDAAIHNREIVGICVAIAREMGADAVADAILRRLSPP